MPKVLLKLSLNLQCLDDQLPSEEEIASVAAELYAQAVLTLKQCGGKCQRVREWRADSE